MKVSVSHALAASAIGAVGGWFVLAAYTDQSCEPGAGWCGLGLLFFAPIFLGSAFLILFAAMLLAGRLPVVSRRALLWTAAGAALGALADWAGLLDRWWTPQSWRTGGDLFGPWFGAALFAAAFALAALLGWRSGDRLERAPPKV